MPGTNFDLAPPVKTVDGLKAVPIDIQKITASLTFNGATSSGAGDATFEFITSPEAGNPIFDLRQTITDAWLTAMTRKENKSSRERSHNLTIALFRDELVALSR